jgi:F0F1-type ATP synthase epsilon subunit
MGDIAGVAVEGEEGELGARRGHPPGVELGAVGRAQPGLFHGQPGRLPVAAGAARSVGEISELVFEDARQHQQRHVGNRQPRE